MIVNRSQLLTERVVGDRGMFQLNRDGSSVASNKKGIVAVEGVRRTKGVPLEGGELGVDSVAITRETAKSILSDVPRDRKFKGLLEHADIRAVDPGSGELRIETTDGKRSKIVKARGLERAMVNMGKLMGNVLRAMRRGNVICLNRKRLIALLEAMDKSAEDTSGESAVWISIEKTGNIGLKTINYITGQRIYGYMRAYEGGRAEDEETEWERGFRKSMKRRRRK